MNQPVSSIQGLKTIRNKSAIAYREHFDDPSLDYHIVVRDEVEEAQTNIRNYLQKKIAKRIAQESRVSRHLQHPVKVNTRPSKESVPKKVKPSGINLMFKKISAFFPFIGNKIR